MDKKHILIVDDEQDLCCILRFNLEAVGYAVSTAYSAEEALSLHLNQFSLMLLDIMMPGMSGYELAQRIKNNPDTAHTPIIFITAKETEDDVLRGFLMGADDYVSKPFSVREVVARVGAVLSRTTNVAQLLTFETLRMDLTSMSLTIDDQSVALTKTEFEILRLLLTYRGQIFSRQELIRKVWPSDVIVTERTVDVNIARLRKKLGPYTSCIANKKGFGYLFL